jgi:hypothetical protein
LTQILQIKNDIDVDKAWRIGFSCVWMMKIPFLERRRDDMKEKALDIFEKALEALVKLIRETEGQAEPSIADLRCWNEIENIE